MNGLDVSALGQIKETFQFLQPMLDQTLRLAPNPKTPKQRRTEGQQPGRHDPDPAETSNPPDVLQCLRVMGQLILRHERGLNLLQSTDSFILYFQQDKAGTLQGLVKETQTWQTLRQQNPEAPQRPLRQHLCLWLLKELQTRALKVSECKVGDPIQQACLEKKLILEDMSWPFLRWDPSQKALVIDRKKAVTMPKMLQHLEELIEDFQDSTLVVRFQGLQTSNAQAAVPWKLQLNMRTDRPYELLAALTHSSIWLLAGTTLKLHSTKNSHLADTLHQLMTATKGRGKGGKSQGKHKGS